MVLALASILVLIFVFVFGVALVVVLVILVILVSVFVFAPRLVTRVAFHVDILESLVPIDFLEVVPVPLLILIWDAVLTLHFGSQVVFPENVLPFLGHLVVIFSVDIVGILHLEILVVLLVEVFALLGNAEFFFC